LGLFSALGPGAQGSTGERKEKNFSHLRKSLSVKGARDSGSEHEENKLQAAEVLLVLKHGVDVRFDCFPCT
jgi:hypothetical protein